MQTELNNSLTEEPPGGGTSLKQLDPTRHITESILKTLSRTAPVQGERSLPFPLDPQAEETRRRLFPHAGRAEFCDWRWQLAHRVTTARELEQHIELSPTELEALGHDGAGLPLAITPYYLGLISPDDPAQPLRRTMVPDARELEHTAGEAADPLSEEHDSPVPGVVHRYPDRALFLVTDYCSAYCRYCTRSRMVGRRKGPLSKQELQKALDYIAATPTLRDIIVSGGDPLTMADEAVEWLLRSLRAIPHVEVVRIGTKTPVVLPQRITRSLVRILKKYHPLWMSLHCTHPEELTPAMSEACTRLADAGIPLGSQTVLLKGVNDSPKTLGELYRGLMRVRVRPYYLYQCDPILGSAHFRTPVQTGLECAQGLRGHTSGYAVPHYVIDAPGGGGKIPLLPETVLGRAPEDPDNLLLKNYEGGVFRYPDPAPPETGRHSS